MLICRVYIFIINYIYTVYTCIFFSVFSKKCFLYLSNIPKLCKLNTYMLSLLTYKPELWSIIHYLNIPYRISVISTSVPPIYFLNSSTITLVIIYSLYSSISFTLFLLIFTTTTIL